MAEIRTVTTLTSKREALERAVAEYERALAQARIDLGHVIATIELMGHADPDIAPRYSDVGRIFKRHELTRVSLAALADGPLNTRELTARIMATKGFDPKDVVVAKAVAMRVVHAMRSLLVQGKVGDAGRRKNVRVWMLK